MFVNIETARNLISILKSLLFVVDKRLRIVEVRRYVGSESYGAVVIYLHHKLRLAVDYFLRQITCFRFTILGFSLRMRGAKL